MRRSTALLVGGLLSICVASHATAQTQDLLLSGDPKLAIIDADDNGSITDADDCMLSATVDPGANLVVEGTQAPGPNLLRPCTGSCGGSSSVSPNFVELIFDNCDYAHAPFVPLLADFCDTVASCNEVGMVASSLGASAGAGTAAGLPPPVNLVSGVIARTSVGLERVGFGVICGAGGPAVQITGDDNVTVLRQLEPFPNATNPTHMCVDNVPVQLASNGLFVLRTACFPTRNNGADFSLSGDPERPIAFLDFLSLPSCGGAQGAPTASVWGLIGLLVALLVAGTWTLKRRAGFAESLPLP